MKRNSTTIGVSELAKCCDITPRQVQNLTGKGIFHRATDAEGKELRGRYPESSVREYIRYLRKRARLDDSSESEHAALKIRKTRAEVDVAERRALQFKGILYHGADIEFAIVNMLTALKQGMLALPSAISRNLIGKKKYQEVHEILRTAIEGVLNRISPPDRDAFIQLAAARLARQGVNLPTQPAAEAS